MTESSRKEDERLTALLGLAASRPEPVEKCPEPELLSAFIENRLSPSRRQQILDHLDRCECCYREWLDVSLDLGEDRPPAPTAAGASGWRRWWERVRTRSGLIPLTIAVTVTLAAVAVMSQKSVTPDWQPRRLAALVRKHAGTQRSLTQWPRTGPAAFSFSDSDGDPARKAFAAGLRDAQRWLGGGGSTVSLGEEDWRRSPWQAYYRLGQWTLLLWTLANSDGVSPEEWQAFDRHGLALMERFRQRPRDPERDRLLATLRELHALLNDLAGHPDPAAQARLVRKLRNLIRRWLL